MNIAKRGDIIKWEWQGKEYTAEVAMVDREEEVYGVYCEYGQDLISFDKAEKVNV